ncbi:hypothetical protein BK011_09115 [Tenericutes bacterium MZ-XQ]|nr:hypothetical protein BK011_09115 [Tenericutes bacterium MZ-XQ]
MKDERIAKEMNQVKKYVLLYVFIASIVLAVLKLLVFGFNMRMFYVEGFIILSSMILFSIVSLKQVGDYDERIERSISKTYHIGFIFIFIGGLWVHFYQVLSSTLAQSTVVNMTNTLILIGFIVAMIFLKRKGLYANYKYIESSKSNYYSHVFLNVLIILLTFGLIYVTVLFTINKAIDFTSNIYFLLSIIISFIMVSVEYILFSIYEKNHYDEVIAFEENRSNIMSKNAFLFQLILFVFAVFSGYVNYRLMIITSGSLLEQRESFNTWMTIQTFTKLVALDFTILSLISSLIICYFLRKLIGKHKILSLFLSISIVSFVIQVLQYFHALFLPLLQNVIEPHEAFIQWVMTYGRINLGIMVVFTLIYITIGIYLYIKNVPFKRMFLIYSILLLGSNPLISDILFKSDLQTLYTLRFLFSTLQGAYLLLLIGVLAYNKYPKCNYTKKIEFEGEFE